MRSSKPILLVLLLLLFGATSIFFYNRVGKPDAIKQSNLFQETKANNEPAEKSAIDSAIVATILHDLDNDQVLDTLILRDVRDIKGDPGLYNQIEIKTSQSGTANLLADKEEAWNSADEIFLKKNVNAVKSDLTFVKKYNGQTYLMLFGWLYGSGREIFSIIKIGKGEINEVFSEPVDVVHALHDINNDGNLDFVCNKGFVEMYEMVDSLNAQIGTYSPYLVYSLIGENFKLNEALSKSYNEEHYVFAGLKYNGELKVLYPNNRGKPRLLN